MNARFRALAGLVLVSVTACAPRTAPSVAATAATSGAGQWEAEIRAFEEQDLRQPPQPGGVVFVGSSSIRLWNTLQQDFPGVRVVNRGFGGSELEHSVRYADRIILPHRPRMVVVYAGTNDLAAGKTPDRVVADYRALVQRIHRELPETRIAFISIAPSRARQALWDKMRIANEEIRRMSERDPRLLYIDVFTPMVGPGGAPRDELFVADGLHLNPQGYALWRSVVGPYLEQARR